MLAARLQRGGQRQQRLARHARGRQCIDHDRTADRQRAGLVEGDDGDPVRDLERLGVLDEHAVTGRDAGARHDRGRGREAERARAGDHQDRDRRDHRGLDAAAGEQPAGQGGGGDHKHDRYEYRRDTVHDPLDRRLRRLGVFDHPDDPSQHCFGADCTDLEHDAPRSVDRAADQPVARMARYRQGLAGQHRLVDLGVALVQHAVDREPLAGQHHHPVADGDARQGHDPLVAVLEPSGRVGPQRLQRPDRLGRAAPCPGLQVLAEQHQCDHHGRAFVVQVGRVARMGGEPQPGRQPPACGGPDRHQQVHVAGAGFERRPAGPVEAGAEDELDRRGDQGLQPGRQHRVDAEGQREHRQRERGRQGHRPGNAPPFGGEATLGRVGRRRAVACLPARGVRSRRGRVACGGDRLLQRRDAIAADDRDPGRLRGEVDRDVDHERQALQRPLDAADTARAGHAFDDEVDGRGRHGIAGGLDRGDGRGRREGGAADGRGLTGEVDRGVRDARQLAERALDAGDAGRAGHAFDRQRQRGSGGGGFGGGHSDRF